MSRVVRLLATPTTGTISCYTSARLPGTRINTQHRITRPSDTWRTKDLSFLGPPPHFPLSCPCLLHLLVLRDRKLTRLTRKWLQGLERDSATPSVISLHRVSGVRLGLSGSGGWVLTWRICSSLSEPLLLMFLHLTPASSSRRNGWHEGASLSPGDLITSFWNCTSIVRHPCLLRQRCSHVKSHASADSWRHSLPSSLGLPFFAGY